MGWNSPTLRDLKPGNVWLTGDSVAKIGDFGLAVAIDRSRLTSLEEPAAATPSPKIFQLYNLVDWAGLFWQCSEETHCSLEDAAGPSVWHATQGN